MTVTIAPQAQPFVLSITNPKFDTKRRMKEFWDKVQHMVPPEVMTQASKGGFRDVPTRVAQLMGGVANFYRPVLLDIVTDHLLGADRQVLLFNSVDIKDEGMMYQINAGVHMEPEIRWTGPVPGVEGEITVTVKEEQHDIEALVNEQVELHRNNSTILVPAPEGSELKEGQVVVLDHESLIDGEKWEPGSGTNVKWLMDRNIVRSPEIVDTLIGAKAGEDRTATFTLNEKYGDMTGKTSSLKIHVHQIYNRELPAIDDDLAITNNHKNLVEWKADLKNRIEEKLKQMHEIKVVEATLDKMKEVVEVGPIPHEWVSVKGEELYKKCIQMAGNDEEAALSRFKGMPEFDGVETLDRTVIIPYLGQLAAQSLVGDLLLKSWGKIKGVRGDSNLYNMHIFVAEVKKELLKIVQISKE